MTETKLQDLLHELNLEYEATRKCLERLPFDQWTFKPHPKSMEFGYLALLVAEIPLWIRYMLVEGEIDFATFPHADIKSTEQLVQHFEENMAAARKALQEADEKSLDSEFTLKANGQKLYSTKKRVDLGVTLNHWVHHRGQLTVYMRLLDVDVPSLYGPSADDKSFRVPE